MIRIKYAVSSICKQGTNLPTARFQDVRPIDLVAKLPVRQQVAALSDAILVAPAHLRDELAIQLIELASFSSPNQGPNQLGTESAAGPIELLARIPAKWRARHAGDAMLGVARAWDHMSIPMKELAAGLGRDRWLASARTLSQDANPRARLAAISIAHDTADPGFAKIVGNLLADEHSRVRRAADQTILRLTMVMLDHLPAYLLGEELSKLAKTHRIPLPADPAVIELERCTLLGSIADAAWSFASHRCRSPLLAALLVMDRAVATPMEREIASRLRRLLSERNHPSHSPIRTVLRRTPCPILRERSLRWLTIAPISTAAMDRLASADSIEEHQVVLQRSHLAMRPQRAARLASLRIGVQLTGGNTELSQGGALPTRDVYHQLNDESRLGLIRMTSLISLEDQARRNLLEPALADSSSRVRFRACDSSSSIDLPDFMYDVNHSIARHAALSWSSVGQIAPKVSGPAWTHRNEVAGLNSRSPHAWVRRTAAEESDRLSLVRPDSPASRIQARRLYQTDPALFVRTLRNYLTNPHTQCDALMLIRMLGVEERFELDLIALVQDTQCDSKARATAVMSLGAIDSNASRYIVSEAMGDADDRIRSNAVETIEDPAHGSIDQILELKADPHHRVRASAIRRVIRDADSSQTPQARQAGQALLEMLHDDRPMHQLAATWAAQRTLTGSSREIMGAAWKPLINEIEAIATRRSSDVSDVEIKPIGLAGASAGVTDNDSDRVPIEDHQSRMRTRAQICIHRIGCDIERSRLISEQSMHADPQWSQFDSRDSDFDDVSSSLRFGG